jgi:hypothetical protein
MKPAALLPADIAAFCPLTATEHPIAHGIISQAVLTAPGLRVTRFQFATGQELSEHTSPARVVVQVLSGSCEFSVEDISYTIKSGDFLHVPPGRPHAVRAPEALNLLVIQATPPSA